MQLLILNANGIAEGAAVSFKMHLHPIAILELDAFAEAEGMRTKEMHMDRARCAMPVEFEVMVFQICKAVLHVLFTCLYCLMP